MTSTPHRTPTPLCCERPLTSCNHCFVGTIEIFKISMSNFGQVSGRMCTREKSSLWYQPTSTPSNDHMSLVYRFSRCTPPVRTAGNPSIHAEKDQMFCVANWWSSAFKQVDYVLENGCFRPKAVGHGRSRYQPFAVNIDLSLASEISQ